MEMQKMIENIINNENDCETNKESANELKTKLKKQIEQLKSIILQIEWSLEITKFSKIKCVIQSQTPSVPRSNKIPNINNQFKFELYKYSGFYCSKYGKQEYIFNFSSVNKYDKENTYAVQILIDKEKVTLGKWLMPMSLDLNDIISNLRVNTVKDVPYFLHTCKHYIDCYFLRQKQYITLMDVVSQTKNCYLQASLGYTQINLELTGVYNKIEDNYMNIIVYLLYDTTEIRPHKIRVDPMGGETLHSKSIKHLKDTLACFKRLDLHLAFKKILNKEPFIWSREKDEDSPLDMNNTSSSDSEGFLEEYLSSKEKSLRLSESTRNIKRSRRIAKRRKTTDSENSLDTSINHSLFVSPQNVEQENEKQVENRKQHTKSKIDSGITKSVSTVNKLDQKKLKQTKLEFRKHMVDLNTQNNAGPSKTTPPKKKTMYRIQNQPFTSTPIHQRGQGPNSIVSNNTDISDITVNTDNFQNIRNNMKILSPKNNKLKGIDRFESDTPVKVLRAKMKRNRKSAK